MASLISHSFTDWLAVIDKVLLVALDDHIKDNPRKDGLSLIMYCDRSRNRHRRLLTTVYNQFRDELETDLNK